MSHTLSEMRLSSLLLLTVVSVGSLVEARSFPELYSRSTTDTCGGVNAELVVTDPKLHTPVHVGLVGAPSHRVA